MLCLHSSILGFIHVCLEKSTSWIKHRVFDYNGRSKIMPHRVKLESIESIRLRYYNSSRLMVEILQVT